MYFLGHKGTQQTSNPFTTQIPSNISMLLEKPKSIEELLSISTTKDQRYLGTERLTRTNGKGRICAGGMEHRFG